MKTTLQNTGVYSSIFARSVMMVLVIFGMVLFYSLSSSETNAANSDNRSSIDRNDKVSALKEIVKDRNWIGKGSQLSAVMKYSNLNKIRSQAVNGTPFGIVSIESEYFDPTSEEYILLWRENFESLASGNGYSVTQEVYGEGIWLPFCKREIVADDNGRAINFNGYTYDFFGDQWILDEQGVIEYDGLNRPISVIEQWLDDDENWITYGTTSYTYNTDGSISYEENYDEDEESYIGSFYQEGDNMVDEYVEDFLGDMYYYRDTYYNISLEDYLQYEEYYFTWIEMDFEEKINDEDEYELYGTYRNTEESSDQIIFLYSELSFNSDSEEIMEPNYRDIINYSDGKIASHVMEDYEDVDGDWVGVPSMRYRYNYDTNVSNEIKPEVVDNFKLSQNYPNPFNPTTNISYELPEAAQVKLQVFDVLGHEVSTLVDAHKPPGSHTVKFDGSSLSSGIYIYSIEAGNYISTRKMLLVK